MRLFQSGVFAAGLLISQFAAAECVRPADHAALDVAGLKSQLMVTALTCKASDRYNAFITKYRPELNAQEKLENSYFSRSYGRAGTKRHDDYITQLANAKSQAGVQQGSLFCDRSMSIFDEVMALKDGAELQQYAAGRSNGTPMALTDCGGNASERTTTAARASTRTARPHRS